MIESQIEQIRDTLRKFCAQEVIPKRKDMDRDPQICKSLIQQLGKMGFLAPMLPEEYGGMDLSHQTVVLFYPEIIRANPSLGLSVAAHSLLCASSILLFGSNQQKSQYLPKLARGEQIGAWAVTEPGAGSDVNSIQASAKQNGDTFILNGNKTFITNAPIADVLIVYVKTDTAAPNNISGFILERGMPGVSLSKPMDKFGMEGSPTGDIFMDNVKVPKSLLLGKMGEGFRQITAGFNHERMYAAPAAATIMRHCLETAMKYAAQRQAFGKSIIEFQAIQLKIARIYAQMIMTEAAVNQLFHSPMDTPDFHLKVSAVKIFSTQWAVEACLDTMQILGGLGYTRDCDIERFMRDAKLFEIGGGTTDIQHLIIFKGLIKQFFDKS